MEQKTQTRAEQLKATAPKVINRESYINYILHIYDLRHKPQSKEQKATFKSIIDGITFDVNYNEKGDLIFTAFLNSNIIDNLKGFFDKAILKDISNNEYKKAFKLAILGSLKLKHNMIDKTKEQKRYQGFDLAISYGTIFNNMSKLLFDSKYITIAKSGSYCYTATDSKTEQGKQQKATKTK